MTSEDSGTPVDADYCRLMFGARPETIARLSELYGKEYFADADLERKRAIMYDQEMVRLGGYVDLARGGSVLDVGCGPGAFLRRFPDGWDKYGIEVSPYARAQAQRAGVRTDFAPEDGMFDLIVFRGTWQHLPNPVSRIEDCYYWLKPGGIVAFLATPNVNCWYYKRFGRRYTPVNFLMPSDVMLDQILRNFGFEVLDFYYPYLGTPYARPVRDAVLLVLKTLGLYRREVPTFGKVMECFARRPDRQG